MNNEQKAEMYNQLMYEYTRTQNQISSIRGESINLNESQLKMVRDLENKLKFLMDKVTRL
jgi:predicted nuclease with TOPRIM domain